MKYLGWHSVVIVGKIVEISKVERRWWVGKILNKGLSLSIKYLIVCFEEIFRKFIYKF